MFELPYKQQYVWWEAWRLMERFIIAGMSVFLTNPIYRIMYKKRLDAVSWVCLFWLSLILYTLPYSKFGQH